MVRNFIKKDTLPQLFLCKYREIFKNSFLAASENGWMTSKKFLLSFRGICTKEFIRNPSLSSKKFAFSVIEDTK